ncbi:carboxylating nicotinate-nucleotide diphosphorylase [Georgenia sp. M64]|uniref:carboxylating nicotinate-nucleotide diphosphorylase n=1 Tax=Georgenia sp. M64 TaxID=3120520 RepID=UPI0030DE4C64
MRTLSPLLVEPLVRAALLEDLGRAGDLTSDTVVPAERRATVALVVRDPGVVAGTDLAVTAFGLVDPRTEVTVQRPDGSRVSPGDVVARVTGPARGILTAERVALNFLGHLSGVATATAQIADAVAHTATRVTCTRKTTPGLRAVEKHAVLAGGGVNHRFGLDDAVLIKDNHIALAGGVRAAITAARAGVGHLVKIEIEVDTLDQLREVLTDPVDAVLLDNMTPEQLREAVTLVGGRMVTEASGRLTAATAPAVAASGVDLMSAGWVTHSAPVLDIGLDVLELA